MSRSKTVLAAAFMTLAATAARAQAQAPPGAEAMAPPTAAWSVGLGAGVIASPAYRGASTYKVRPVPALTIRHGEDFALSGLEAAYTPVRSGPWRAGAQARFRFGQKEKDHRAALRGLGNVGASVELGGFVAYGRGPVTLKAALVQDVAGGHGGQVATLGAAYTARLRRTAAGPVLLSVGPTASWASARFNRVYYGVDAGQSARSGLAVYRPGSGLESVGFSGSLVAPLSDRVTLAAVAGYDRIAARGADSPRIRGRGSRDQGTLGAFISYRWL